MATQVIKIENWVNGTLNDITVINPAQNIVYTEKDSSDPTLLIGIGAYPESRLTVNFPSATDLNVFHANLIQTIAHGTAGTSGTAALIGSNITRVGTVSTTTTTTIPATTTTTTVSGTTTTTTIAPPSLSWEWSKDPTVSAVFRVKVLEVPIVDSTDTVSSTKPVSNIADRTFTVQIVSSAGVLNSISITANGLPLTAKTATGTVETSLLTLAAGTEYVIKASSNPANRPPIVAG